MLRVGDREFSSHELELIHELTLTFGFLSRKELANTICENLKWTNSAGNLKVMSCLNLLEKLEFEQNVKLPAKMARRSQEKPKKELYDIATKDDVQGNVEDYVVRLKLVVKDEERRKWNDLVGRYHYLGYKRNFGLHLKYFIYLDGFINPVGGLSFEASASYHLKCRDELIGWDKKARESRLNWIVNNNRFILFPWIKVMNLGSKVLSLCKSQVVSDWYFKFKYEPVLLETFVDSEKFNGTIYKSANWEKIGQTSGNYNHTNKVIQSSKDVYICSLNDEYKEILLGTKKIIYYESKKRIAKSPLEKCIDVLTLNEQELNLWEQIQLKIALVCQRIDDFQMSQLQKMNALTMLLALYRITYAKNFESYSSVLCELLDHANHFGIRLSFGEAISASTFCDARKNFPSQALKEISDEIIELYEKVTDKQDEYLWHGKRIFAVDGSKVNLPRKTLDSAHGGYKLPCSHAFYPQGLISSLYRLKSNIAYDFNLVNSMNELEEALKHLKKLKPGDVVIYDRGYLSYALIFMHNKLGIDAIFRLKKQSFKTIDEFIKSDAIDTVTTIAPSKKSFYNIKKSYRFIDQATPFKMRLMKYKIDENEYYIGTTILDPEISIEDYSQTYHGRWGHEEFYKTLKHQLKTIEFHGKTEQFIQQELYSGFNILTLNRIMANTVEAKLEENIESEVDPFQRNRKVNFKKQIDDFYRHVEPIIAGDQKSRIKILNQSTQRAQRQSYRTRPNRSYDRKSHRHINKWQKAAQKKSESEKQSPPSP